MKGKSKKFENPKGKPIAEDYSEGDSGSSFPVRYRDLKKEKQLHRVLYLWRKVYQRSRGGARLIQVFYNLHKRILLFGTTKNLLGQHVYAQNQMFGKRNCLLMPDDSFKTFWNIIIIVLLLYTALFVPFKIAFIETNSIGMVAIEYIVDIIFALDIFVNFISATEDTLNNTIIVKHKEIAKNYIKSWFILDLIACFPF